MTNSIIYHDFRQTNSPAIDPKPNTVLTASVLTKGRRWHKFWGNLQKATEAVCLILCGAGIAFSIYIFSVLL